MKNRFALWVYVKSPSIVKKIVRKICGKSAKSECESEFLREIWEYFYGVKIGNYTYGCFNDSFPAGTIVGKYCSISKGVKALNADHPVSSVCLTPYFYNKSLGFDVEDVSRSKLIIGNDVWIGCNSVILSKCTSIGNGAIIGAGSIVTKDVPPYAIVAGNPAKIIRYRFDKDTCEQIENTRWWEDTPEHLYKMKEYMNNPKVFCENYGGAESD